MAYVRFLLRANKFDDMIDPNDLDAVNSHMPMADKYRAMLDRWMAMDRPHEMTLEQIRTVVGNRPRAVGQKS